MKRVAFFTAAAICTSSFSQQLFGSWFGSISNDGSAAVIGTLNDSGNTLTLACLRGADCYWQILTSTPCEAGSTAPIIGNSDKGSQFFNVRCENGIPAGSTYKFVFQNNNDFWSFLPYEGNVGFAMPMKSGEFKVMRFNINGVQKAVAWASEASQKLGKKKSYDQTL